MADNNLVIEVTESKAEFPGLEQVIGDGGVRKRQSDIYGIRAHPFSLYLIQM